MWNDGPAKQPWLNYFNEYELQHCCFGGDGGNDDNNGSTKTDNTISGREGEDKTSQQEIQEEKDAAAAAAKSAADAAKNETVDEVGSPNTGPAATDGFDISFGPDEEGKLAPDSYDPEQDLHAVTDPNTGTTSVKDGTGRDVTDEVGYNDLVDLGFFDKLDKGIQDFDKGLARDFNAELKAKDLDAQVAVDKFGNYTYTGPDKYSALGGALVDTAMELSPTIQLGKTINEQGGLSGFFGKAKDDLVSAFSRSPSASQTLSTLAGSDKDLSGLAGFGEYRGGLKGEKGSEGYVSPESFQAQLSADRNAAATRQQEAFETGGLIDPLEVAYRNELANAAAAKEKADRNVAATANQYAADVLGIDPDAQAYRDALADMNSVRANTAFTAMQTEADKRDARNRAATESQRIEDIVNVLDLPSLSPRQVRGINSPFGGPRQTEADRRRDALEKVRAEIEEENRRKANLAAVENMLKYRSEGGMVYRNKGGEVEKKTKSAMELYLEKLGQPSKYTVPDFPMNTPSMVSPPDTSDPFALAEYRKNLARETMGNYLPFDAGGASSAINTFNENYYGGASNVNPYNVAQLASLYGLPRDAGTYEGIIGMLGGVRNEPPPPPPVVPDPEPEPVIVEEEDDDNWSMYDDEEIDQAFAKGGGGIRDVLYRQTGGPAAYDPVREEAARRRARELQAIKIGELGTAPQTRAEREALQASGGFYRDDEGEVRDAMGNVQEDFAFDYVAPPPPDPYDPVNTPDTPAPEPEPEPFKLDTTPLPGGLVRNQETGEITVDPEGAKSTEWGISREIQDTGTSGEWSDFNEQEFLQQAYEKGKRYTGLGIGDLGGGWSIERTNPGSSIWNPPNSPSDYNYALKGPEKTFLPKPGPLPDIPNPIYQPMVPVMGQQLQPTGLQGLNQNIQGFGMQSPVPFGTQQPFSSGFGGFGQQQGYNR